MSYTLTHADPSVSPVTIAPLTVDDKSTTSLYFNGRGIPNFGQGQQNNFLLLLESFASTTPPGNPMIGQVWYDKSNYQLKVYDGASWHYVAEDAIATGTGSPQNPVVGQLWYNQVENILRAWNGSSWMIPGACVAQVSATAPSSPQTGQLWYDTNVKVLKIYNGSAWTLTVDPGLQYLAFLM